MRLRDANPPPRCSTKGTTESDAFTRSNFSFGSEIIMPTALGSAGDLISPALGRK